MRQLASWHLAALAAAAVGSAGCTKEEASADVKPPPGRDGSAEHPLIVQVIPSETGAPVSVDDYKPLFAAITRHAKIHVELAMAESADAVVDGMVAGQIDLAFLDPNTFEQAHRRGAADLLAAEETGGQSVSYAGIFHRSDSGMNRLSELRGKSLALGDQASIADFRVPVAMLLAARLDPARHLDAIVLAGSGGAALEQLAAGKVDAAAASVGEYDKLVAAAEIDGTKIVLLAKSDPIPSPAIAMRSALLPEVKTQLRGAFHGIHEAEGVTPAMRVGYGGAKVDRYDAEADPVMYERLMKLLAPVTQEIVNDIAEKAGKH